MSQVWLAGLRGPAVTLGLAVGLLALAGAAGLAADRLPGDVAEAIGRLGGPGVLWGRVAIEEESPDGPRTPLGDVAVTAYLATQPLLDGLERLRRTARDSWAAYDSAVARVQAALDQHQAQVDLAQVPALAALARPGAEARPAARPLPGRRPRSTPAAPATPATPAAPALRVIRAMTDASGLFVFEDLPAGDWLVVARRVVPYGPGRMRAEPKPRSGTGTQRFLPRATGPAQDAEVWLAAVRLEPGGRRELAFTDRTRFLVGPLR